MHHRESFCSSAACYRVKNGMLQVWLVTMVRADYSRHPDEKRLQWAWVCCIYITCQCRKEHAEARRCEQFINGTLIWIFFTYREWINAMRTVLNTWIRVQSAFTLRKYANIVLTHSKRSKYSVWIDGRLCIRFRCDKCTVEQYYMCCQILYNL